MDRHRSDHEWRLPRPFGFVDIGDVRSLVTDLRPTHEAVDLAWQFYAWSAIDFDLLVAPRLTRVVRVVELAAAAVAANMAAWAQGDAESIPRRFVGPAIVIGGLGAAFAAVWALADSLPLP